MFFVDDYGLTVTITVSRRVNEVLTPLDISAATSMQFEFGLPDQSITTTTAAFVTDGTDGQVDYVIESGVLTVAGVWTVRALIVTSPTASFRTSKVKFSVAE